LLVTLLFGVGVYIADTVGGDDGLTQARQGRCRRISNWPYPGNSDSQLGGPLYAPPGERAWYDENCT
jgi:hypothetical protein